MLRTDERAGLRKAIGAGLIIASLGVLFPSTAGAGDLAAGRGKAKACASCHGLDGLSLKPDAPNIAGQPEFYLLEQLRQYRSGARVHAQMNVAARTLTDTDMADLVAYYSSIELSVTVPE